MKHYFPKAAPLSPQERDLERRKKSSKKYKGVDVEKSFYYLWFEYLRRSDDYKKACAKNGKGMAKLYKDFGDVHSEKYDDYLGFWADEKVDRLGWSNHSLKYKFFKALEIKLFQQADIVVTLTESSKEFIRDKFKKLSNSVRVIRTCVDFSEFNANKRAITPYDFNRKLVIGYLGSIDTAYDFNLFLRLIKDLDSRGLKIKLKILSKATPEIVMQYLNENNLSFLEHEVLFLKRHELSKAINQFDLLGFALKPSFSLIASMPTKIAESLACGTPIICNNFNDDIKDMIEVSRIGVLHDFSQNLCQENYEDILSIIQDADASERCCNFSKENFSLELGVRQYADIYNSLL